MSRPKSIWSYNSKLKSRPQHYEISKSAPFSYTCRNFQVSDCAEFEESAPFSYTCRNFQVSVCVEFEESAPFSYTCRNFQVSVLSLISVG